MRKHTSSDDNLLCDLHDLGFHGDSLEHLEKLEAYIKTNYILKADVVEAIDTKIPNWANGAGEKEKFIRSMQDKQTRDTIRESLNLEGADSE